MRAAGPDARAVGLGIGGLLLVFVTLVLVLRVIRHSPVSFRSVQTAHRGPLRTWRNIIEAEQDLYLPCGIRCLTTLRQTMIVEEVTLNVLVQAINSPDLDTVDKRLLTSALKGRMARLAELREAVSQVVAIADYYLLHRRSTIATTLGGLSAALATMAIIAAFLVPG